MQAQMSKSGLTHKAQGVAMWTSLLRLSAAIVLLHVSVLAQPVEKGVLDDDFFEAMKENAPAWALVGSWSHEGSHLTLWRVGALQLRIEYFVLDDPRAASELFEKRRSLLPVPTEKIDRFGDESVLLAQSHPKGNRTIWLRRGRVIVEVSAPDLQSARRFAALFLARVDRSPHR
jgi:hypothetical protein